MIPAGCNTYKKEIHLQGSKISIFEQACGSKAQFRLDLLNPFQVLK